MKSGSSETEVLHFFFVVNIILSVLPIRIFMSFLILRTILTICSDIVDKKCNNVAAAVLFNVDHYTKAKFEGHAVVNETMTVQTDPYGGRPFPISSLAGQPTLAPPGRRRFSS